MRWNLFRRFRSWLHCRLETPLTRPKLVRPRLETLEDRATPANVYWAADVSGDWDVPTNWADDHGRPGVPGVGDDVEIHCSVPVTVTITEGAHEVSSVICEGSTLVLNDGSLTAEDTTVDPGIIIYGGTFNFNGGTLGSRVFILSAALNIGSGSTGAGNFLAEGTSSLTGNVATAQTLEVRGNPANGPGILNLADGTVNEGTIQLRSTAGTFATFPARLSIDGTFTNSGTIEAIDGASDGTCDLVGGTFDNSGTVKVDRSTLTINASTSQVSGNTLTGGTWVVTAGGTLVLSNVAITANQGSITLAGTDATFAALNGLTSNAGSLNIQGGRSFATTGDFSNCGTLTIDTGSTFTSNGNYAQTDGNTFLSGGTLTASGTVLLQGGQLAGTGSINGSVNNAALVQIGDDVTVGILRINGGYAQTAEGSLQVKIGGYNAGTDFDQLLVTGQATVDGTLTITLINSFSPNSGDTFSVLSANSVMGIFATLVGDGPSFDQQNDGSNLILVSH